MITLSFDYTSVLYCIFAYSPFSFFPSIYFMNIGRIVHMIFFPHPFFFDTLISRSSSVQLPCYLCLISPNFTHQNNHMNTQIN
ncbi:hypothetical protein BCR42DRAFT_404599, partial [Absidia repens]